MAFDSFGADDPDAMKALKFSIRERKRILALIAIMAVASLSVAVLAISLLYRAAFEEERARLVQTAQSQARLIEAIARFDAQFHTGYPQGSYNATLSQITDAHKNYRGFGKTGEFTLAKRENDLIVFLLSHRHFDLHNPKPVKYSNQQLAEPMRRALSGMSGTVIGLDYRGVPVLAAHEPVKVLDLGIVAKIDMAEVRAPFVKAGLSVIAAAVLIVAVGAFLNFRVSNPIIMELRQRSANLVTANTRLKKEIAEREAAGAALKKSEKRLKVSLDEKNILLKEVHHRVKNNLQIISGLLNMSSLQATHQEARELLQDARGKVYAMALLHTQLYQTQRFDEVDMATHIRHLVDELAVAYGDPAKSIHTAVESSDVKLSLRQAIPFGLIVNELVSNAYKHAFLDRDRGSIHIVLQQENGGDGATVMLKVQDDGVGIPGGVQPEKVNTLGLELVRRLAKQLNGNLRFNSENGMEVTIAFNSVESGEPHG